jgi:hypothetical protein
MDAGAGDANELSPLGIGRNLVVEPAELAVTVMQRTKIRAKSR